MDGDDYYSGYRRRWAFTFVPSSSGVDGARWRVCANHARRGLVRIGGGVWSGKGREGDRAMER